MRKKAARILALFCALVLLPLNSMGVALPAWGAAGDPSVTGLTVQPLDVIEYTWGQWFGDNYVYNALYADFSVTLADGRTLTSEGGHVTVDGTDHYLQFNVIDQFSEPWTVGNTYTVSVELLGAQANMTVRIVESPVESLTVQDMTIAENTGGYVLENGTYCYGADPKYTVKLKDGREFNQSETIEYNGHVYHIGNNAWDLQHNQPWTAGNTYTVKADLLGAVVTFQVTIVQSPVESVTVSDVTYIDHTHGYTDTMEGVYYYYMPSPAFTVKMTDGRTFTSEDGDEVVIDGESYALTILADSLQTKTWVVGNTYTLPASFMGMSTSFNLTIVETPVTEFKVQDMVITEHTHGGWEEDGVYCYHVTPQFSLTLKDGRTFHSAQNASAIEIDGEYYDCEMNAFSMQGDASWTVGNTYTVSAMCMGVRTTFKVTIAPPPAESLTVQDMTILENEDGYMNGDAFRYTLSPQYTLKLKDGREYTTTSSSVEVDGERYNFETNERALQQDEPWTAGNTYTVTATIMGVSTTFRVTIRETPIASVTIPDVTVIEGTNGYVYNGHFVYTLYTPTYTAKLKDGREVNATGGINIDGTYYSINTWDTQQDEPWTAGNTYKVNAIIAGFVTTFNVRVEKSPVAKLQVDDATVQEGSGERQEDGTYFYTFRPSYTVTLNDGRTFRSDDGTGTEIDGKWHYLEVDFSSQWSEPWTAGNTYTVSATFMGTSVSCRVTVQETPVASVTVKGVSIIEGTHGEVQSDGHFRYELTNVWDSFRPEFEVTLKNGRKLQSQNGYVKMDNEWLPLTVIFPDQSESPWTVGGTYEADGWFMGVHASIEVRIVKNPIVALRAEDLTLMEGGNEGYYDFDAGEFKYYRDDILVHMMQFSVELADGAVIRSEAGRIEPDYYWDGGQGTALYIDNVCYDRCTMDAEVDLTLSVGEHTLPVEFMGAKANLSVTVKKSPVVGLTIEDITLVRGVDSQSNSGSDWYDIYPTFTLTMQDGSRMVVKGDDVRIGDTIMWLHMDLAQWSHPLKAGETYEVAGAFGALSDTFTITVLESPVERVEFIRSPQKVTYVAGETLNLKGAVLRVHYTDGTYEDVSVTRDEYGKDLIAYTSEKLNRRYYLFTDSMGLNVGQESVDVHIMGQTVACPVTVQPSPWTNLTIANGADGNLLITLTNDDGASETMTMWQLIMRRGDWSDDVQQRGGVLVTDKGGFDGTLYYTADMTLQLKAFGLTSNKLASCGWIRVWSSMENYWNTLTNTFDSLTFDGTVTAANIDQLIIYVTDRENLSIENVGGDELREAFATWLGLDEVDLSLSAYYDAESDTYQRPSESYYRVTTPRCMETVYRCVNGVWQISATFVDGSTMTVTLDDSLCVRAAEHTAAATSVLYGDANGDGKVTTADAALILQYAAELIGDGSLSAAAADVNGDGKVTTADAALVLQYAAELITQFPAAK